MTRRFMSRKCASSRAEKSSMSAGRGVLVIGELHEFRRRGVAIRTAPILGQSRERRARRNLPNGIANQRVIDMPAHAAFQFGGVVQFLPAQILPWPAVLEV